MAAGPQQTRQHRVGDRYFAQAQDPPLTLVVALNAYERWTVVIVDRSKQSAVVDMHEVTSLADAQHYAEGYLQAKAADPVAVRWTPQIAG